MVMQWALVVFRYLGSKLPESVRDRAGTAIAYIAFLAMPEKRANMRWNLRVVLEHSSGLSSRAIERRARRLARRSAVSYGQVLADFCAIDRLLPRVWQQTVNTPGLEHLDSAVQEGRGAVFVTAHFGHWDMAAAALARRWPGKIVAVAETFDDPRVNEFVVGQRSSYGLDTVPMDNVRQMTRVLREGKVLGILADRPVPTGEGVPVRFFGQETRFPAGTAVLAMLARCPILVGSLRKRSDGSFEGVVLPPIEPVRTGNRDADVRATMQLVVEHLEKIIRRSPHQWYMFRNMWPAAGEVETVKRKVPLRAAAVLTSLAGGIGLSWLLHTNHAPAALEQAAKP